MHIPVRIPDEELRKKEKELELWASRFVPSGDVFRARIRIYEIVDARPRCLHGPFLDGNLDERDWACLLALDLKDPYLSVLKLLHTSGNRGIVATLIPGRAKHVVGELRKALYRLLPQFTIRVANDPGHKLDEKERIYRAFKKI